MATIGRGAMIGGAAVVLALGGGGVYLLSQPAPQVVTAPVAPVRATPSGIVAAGAVSTSGEADVSAAAGGRVLSVPVQVGQRVTAGELLVQLDPTTAQNNLDAANAQVALAQAHLQQLLAGATPTQVAVAKAQVAQAQAALQSAQSGAQVAQAETALKNAQANYRTQEQITREEIYSPGADVVKTEAQAQLQQAQEAVASAQSALAAAQANSQQAVTSAQSALSVAQANLQNLTAPPQPSEVAAAQAQLQAAQAQAAQAQTALSDTRVLAPQSGVVGAVLVRLGDRVSPTQPLLTVVNASAANLQIVVDVNAVQRSQVAVGDRASVVPSAGGGPAATATVVSLAPTATSQAGVVVYPVILQVQGTPPGWLVPGMAVTATIQSGKI